MSKPFNTLYTNDNLFILNGMNSASVDLIYLDPPFNSKRLYSAPVGSKAAGASFKDMWTWADVNEAYLETMVSDYDDLPQFISSIGDLHSKAMMAYITYMTQRLIECHRVLKDTGSLYLHCDATASHYLKLVLDKIFGRENFRNEIVWKRIAGAGKTSQHEKKSYGAVTDIILFYAKSKEHKSFHPFRQLTEAELNVKFNKVDENGERYYDDSAHIFRPPGLGSRPNLCYKWRGFANRHASGWVMTKARLEEEYQKGNIVIQNGKLQRRKYLRDFEGIALHNLWDDIPIPPPKERTGYPTQKPLALLKRIITNGSNEGDVVLDPFCGCATTCVAAQLLNRKWIGVDVAEASVDLVIQRLSDDFGLFSDFVHRKDIPQRTDVKRIKHSAPAVKDALYKRQKGLCNGCLAALDARHLEVDHIIPSSKGGGDYMENYQLLCGNCNRIKGDRPMEYLVTKIKTIQNAKERVTFG